MVPGPLYYTLILSTMLPYIRCRRTHGGTITFLTSYLLIVSLNHRIYAGIILLRFLIILWQLSFITPQGRKSAPN